MFLWSISQHVTCFIVLIIASSLPTQAHHDEPEDLLWEASSLIVSFEEEPEIQTLVKLSTTVANTGPAFFASPDVPKHTQLKTIRDGFFKLDLQLNNLQQGLEDLQQLIQMTGAQVTYLEAIHRIENAYHEWNMFTDSEQTDAIKDEFIRHFAAYENSAFTLWRGLVPSGGNSLAFDLMEIYQSIVQCNPHKLLLFCVNMFEFINKGLLVESTYHELKQNYERIQRLQEQWGERMNMAQGRCSNISANCETKWRTMGLEIMERTYELYVDTDNAILAEKIYKALTKTVPQRNWAVWAYDDASSYEQHAIIAPQILQIWNKNKKDVTAVGLDPKHSFPRLQSENVSNAFEQIQADAKSASSCTFFKQGEYYRERALLLARKMRKVLPTNSDMAVYAILNKKNIGFKAGNDHYMDEVISSYCVDPPIRLFVIE